MVVSIASIELDASIQCRAAIDTGTVNEYAERMTEGDKFPPVILFGTPNNSWIGDGWHRILGAKQIDLKTIEADIRPGGRVEALRYALAANTNHGQRRTNADKRRCVEIALREFQNLSSRAIAEMCGVSPGLVDMTRPQVPNLGTSKRTGKDGKKQSARKKRTNTARSLEERKEGKDDSVSVGMRYAKVAVSHLEAIPPDDGERQEAFAHVKGWLEEHEG